jgi:alpha-1,2-mannosyltransferase
MPIPRPRPAVTGPAARTATPIPPLLLLPGLGALAIALAAYVQYIRNRPLRGLDLWVYQGGVHQFLQGRSAYATGYTDLGLPYSYPPASLLVFTPLSLLHHRAALYAMLVLGIAATFATLWLTLGMLGHTGTAGRTGVAAAGTGLMLWCAPYQDTFNLGQVNVLLMLLVVADLATPDRSRAKGALIGLATAVKLVPGIFVLYLLLTRRRRAAAVAAATFAALTAAGWIADPAGSRAYWLGGLFAQPNRVASVVGPRYVGNQSLHGLAVRLFGDDAAANLVWASAALAVGVTGMALAVRAHRRGEETLGMLVVAFTGLLLSPIAWSHHWVWIAPLLLVVADVTLRLRGTAQMVAAGLPALVVAVFLCWPIRAGQGGALAARSLIWKAPNFHPDHSQRYTSMGQVVLGESHTLAALGLLALCGWWLRRDGRTPQRHIDVDGRPTVPMATRATDTVTARSDRA